IPVQEREAELVAGAHKLAQPALRAPRILHLAVRAQRDHHGRERDQARHDDDEHHARSSTSAERKASRVSSKTRPSASSCPTSAAELSSMSWASLAIRLAP